MLTPKVTFGELSTELPFFEPESTEIARRIAEAEKEIVHRARELFQDSGNNLDEEQALDSAMCSLRVFRSTLKKREGSIPKLESSSLCG